MRSLRLVVVLAFVDLLGAGAVVAQRHANVAAGFPANRGFDGLGIDSVNHFNGNLVIAIPIGQSYPVNGGFSYGLTLYYNSQAWEHEAVDMGANAVPSRLANAGLGWSLSLGRRNPPLVSDDPDVGMNTYAAPDGSMHRFYPTLHEGEAQVGSFEYTRDGTYLRWSASQIEFPDGMRHSFNSFGYPTEYRDRFNNTLLITYHTSPVSAPSSADPSTLNFWRLVDPHGRTHWIEFQATGLTHQPTVLRQIDLQAFAGSRAVYNFSYNQGSEGGAQGSAQTITGCSSTVSHPVWLLTQIDIPDSPDSSRYSMPISSYGTAEDPCSRGLLERLKLPTWGSLKWQYGWYRFPSASTGRLQWQATSGVVSRQLITAAGSALTPWVYTSNMPLSAPNQPTGELINTVTDPLGHKVKRLFAVCAGAGCTQQQMTEYGLPFSPLQSDGLGRFVSSEVFEASNPSSALRRTLVQYERDPALPPMPSFEDHQRLNQRLLFTRTNYLDDGKFDSVAFSDFDGLGHYRTTILGGDFGFGGDVPKTSFVEFNPARGTFPASFNMFPTGQPWLVNLFDRSRVSEGGAKTFHTRSCFDSSTGFLSGRRTLLSTTTTGALGSHDVLVLFGNDGSGNVSSEQYFGGDPPSLATSGTAPCAPGGAGSTYSLTHQYNSGSLALSKYTSQTFNLVERTIDLSTGLPVLSRDTSTLATRFFYDALGRVTSIQPESTGLNAPGYGMACGGRHSDR